MPPHHHPRTPWVGLVRSAWMSAHSYFYPRPHPRRHPASISASHRPRARVPPRAATVRSLHSFQNVSAQLNTLTQICAMSLLAWSWIWTWVSELGAAMALRVGAARVLVREGGGCRRSGRWRRGVVVIVVTGWAIAISIVLHGRSTGSVGQQHLQCVRYVHSGVCGCQCHPRLLDREPHLEDLG
jgi:hypothetical protein